ncbi:hypothetical protein DVH24_012130 [Malus domestica]|uniref:Uncharacterized protein n=1 Tax=Malus domestica TaxID=3750 RepID=A0A498HLU9_MALDO|nr:hypothetical protein DVH24_012130 [Malus domestica]
MPPRKKVEHSTNKAPDDIESACNSVVLVTSMTERLKGLSLLSPYCCIYKVPERLRSVNKKAYTPQVVSVGPLHYDNKDLLYMEEHKQRYLQQFLHRTGVSLEDYVKKIKAQEERLRGCYEGKASEFKSDVFVSIILVDAAFIIELLLRNFFEHLRDDSDWIFKKTWMLQNIAPDMILLENQLPFFILEDLFADVKSKWQKDELPSITELSYKFFQETVRLQGEKDNLESVSEVKHFVDLIRTLHLPSLKSTQAGGPTSSCTPKVKHFCDRRRRFLPSQKSQTEKPLPSTLNTPSAKKLHQAGVKFEISSSKNLFDIQFDNQGILQIPQVEINDYTELTLRNLLAFEQCHCTENHISDYFCILDGFVNTPMDVDFLVEYGIIVNALGDNNKVSRLINKLCIGVSWNHKNYYFADLSKELNYYCRKPWNKWKASLKQKYFNTPWAIISVIGAGFVIVLAIIQTVCSIISSIH